MTDTDAALLVAILVVPAIVVYLSQGSRGGRWYGTD